MHRRVDPDSFGFVVTDLSRLLRGEMDRRVADAGIGLTAGEARALTHAARAGSVRQNVLAERMGLEPMTLSAYADRLETRGLLTRTTDPTDRRAKLVEPTPAAVAVLATIRTIAADIRAEASHSVSPEDWDRVLQILKLARANLSQVRTAGRDAA